MTVAYWKSAFTTNKNVTVNQCYHNAKKSNLVAWVSLRNTKSNSKRVFHPLFILRAQKIEKDVQFKAFNIYYTYPI